MKREKAAFDRQFAGKKNQFGQSMERVAQEACVVLKEIGAWHRSYSIFFLHYVMSNNRDLAQGLKYWTDNNLFDPKDCINKKIVRMSDDLSSIVNNWSIDRAFEPGTTILRGLPPVPDHLSVKATLIARVVQERHAYNRFAREVTDDRLNYTHDLFYKSWLDALGITEEQFNYLANAINAVFQE